jgi:hypothetical protein
MALARFLATVARGVYTYAAARPDPGADDTGAWPTLRELVARLGLSSRTTSTPTRARRTGSAGGILPSVRAIGKGTGVRAHVLRAGASRSRSFRRRLPRHLEGFQRAGGRHLREATSFTHGQCHSLAPALAPCA